MPQQQGQYSLADAKPIGAYQLSDAEPSKGQTASGSTFGEKIQHAASMLGSAVPAVGATIGGIYGGVPGAAVGGGAGEGYKQVLQHASEIPGAIADVARNAWSDPRGTIPAMAQGAVQGTNAGGVDVGTQTALNAGTEKVGQGLVKVAGKIAPALMQQATNAPLSLAREFPDLSQTMIDHSLTVSKGGLAQARQLLYAAKAEANGALDAATAKGATVSIDAAKSGLQKTLDEQVLDSSDVVGSIAKIASLERKVGAGRSSTMTLREADALKTSLQNEARSLYRSVQMGNSSKAVALEAIAKADMAASLNQAIEDAATRVGVTGYKAANSSAQDLIGATRAISRRILQAPGGSVQKAATELATPATMGAILGGAPGAAVAAAGTVAGRVATTPTNLSRTAVFLSNPTVQGFLRQLPIPLVQAIYGTTVGSNTGPQQ